MTRTKTSITAFIGAALALVAAWQGSAEVLGQGSGGGTQILGGGAVIDRDAPNVDAPRPVLRSTTEKRRWLRDHLTNGVTNKRELMPLLRKVDHLTPRQVDVLTNAVLAQQLPPAEQQQQVQQQMQQLDRQQQHLLQQGNQELARLRFIRQALEDELWLRNAGYGVGYMPVITWLPEGTWFGAAANISPDGRHVRINANPFYSSVGPVYNYNLNSGATQPWMPQSGSQSSNQPLGSPGFNHAEVYGGIPARHQSQAPPAAQPRVWHDGIRTRVGP
jgi:hypothetical protein